MKAENQIEYKKETAHAVSFRLSKKAQTAIQCKNKDIKSLLFSLKTVLNCKVKCTGSRGTDVPITLKQPSKATLAIHITTDFKINLSFGEKVNLAFSPC